MKKTPFDKYINSLSKDLKKIDRIVEIESKKTIKNNSKEVEQIESKRIFEGKTYEGENITPVYKPRTVSIKTEKGAVFNLSVELYDFSKIQYGYFTMPYYKSTFEDSIYKVAVDILNKENDFKLFHSSITNDFKECIFERFEINMNRIFIYFKFKQVTEIF